MHQRINQIIGYTVTGDVLIDFILVVTVITEGIKNLRQREIW